MTKAAREKKQSVDRILVDFMTEFARCLVAAGVTSGRFESIARVAFFAAATERARFSNDRLNQSAVAAMTGLTRSEVRRLANQATPRSHASRDRVEAMLDAWSTDPAYVTSSYQPKKLPFSGAGPSFTNLVRKYGGDVPARSLLRELQRNGYVTVRNRSVSLNAKAQRTREDVRLTRISAAIAALLRATPTDGSQPPRIFVLDTIYPAVSPRGKSLLQRRIADNVAAFISAVQAVGAAAASEFPPSAGQRHKQTRTRVALISEDIE